MHLLMVKFFSEIVSDIQTLMGLKDEEKLETEPLSLWDNKEENIKYGINYSDIGED